MAGLIVAGWDAKNGPSVYAIPLGGSMIQVPFTVGGSGSAYVMGYCDKNWRPNMTREECEAFVRKVVALAMTFDGSSGGMIRTLTVRIFGVWNMVLKIEHSCKMKYLLLRRSSHVGLGYSFVLALYTYYLRCRAC